MIEPDDHGLKKERVIVSETQHGPVATDAAGPDAQTGEADDVSEYSEEAGGLDPAGEDAAAASADAAPADGESPDGASADGDRPTTPGSAAMARRDSLARRTARREGRRRAREFERAAHAPWTGMRCTVGLRNRVKTNLRVASSRSTWRTTSSRSRSRAPGDRDQGGKRAGPERCCPATSWSGWTSPTSPGRSFVTRPA